MYQKIRLKSKKNQVYRIIEDDRSFIEKNFIETEKMEKEAEILRTLKKQGCNVPAVLKIYENTLLLEDLGEVTLLDWYGKKEKEGAVDYSEMINRLSQWMKSFYSITYHYYNKSIILRDVNFRNFMIKDDEVYGVDFEDVQAGNIETDAGKLAAFSMTYHPEMTAWKLLFAAELERTLSRELKLDRGLVLQEREKELLRMKSRRAI
ncbi:RIO1 family regulatory kinase/ATPase [Geosporobacter ferrireducens]|uniref:non-specific serine/threonine protein kinase n=1 Tax=Geosporobacter ferrireducens TaxID=1424294 RepID=A0A1D8GF70_9FIRM|nr:RIO1 family regulatory kinase/ATPase [Geosporobacter ferrireducens]AOT69551.1 hypothetical protein Gferi_08155 [Geosporobacter ferrireducens]MTI54755.1 hypothetical protein [Geosporobacter ferrireducens]